MTAMKSFAFIDASNLFYGGEKSLGWKMDHQKLLEYLKEKYDVSLVLLLYFKTLSYLKEGSPYGVSLNFFWSN